MTDATHTPGQDRNPDTAAVIPEGTLEHVDPNALLLGANVRDDANLNAQFIASVREHTLLQPITAIRTEDGLYVRDGQRRVLAAREVGLPTIPVYVITAGSADTNTATAERTAQQIITNDQRAALSDAQRAKGINQMLLAGVSPSKVAKKLAINRLTVTAATTAAASATAMAALQSGQLSLAEAAAVTESRTCRALWTGCSAPLAPAGSSTQSRSCVKNGPPHRPKPKQRRATPSADSPSLTSGHNHGTRPASHCTTC